MGKIDAFSESNDLANQIGNCIGAGHLCASLLLFWSARFFFADRQRAAVEDGISDKME